MGDIEKILLGQLLTLIIAIFLYYLNKGKEIDFKKEEIKGEINGLCDRIIRLTETRELADLHYVYNFGVFIFSIKVRQSHEDFKGIAKSLADGFYNKMNDAETELNLAKSELITKVYKLLQYNNEVEYEKQIEKLAWQINNTESRDVNGKKYFTCTSIDEMTDLFESEKVNIKVSPIRKPCVELQRLLNFKFYRVILEKPRIEAKPEKQEQNNPSRGAHDTNE